MTEMSHSPLRMGTFHPHEASEKASKLNINIASKTIKRSEGLKAAAFEFFQN